MHVVSILVADAELLPHHMAMVTRSYHMAGHNRSSQSSLVTVNILTSQLLHIGYNCLDHMRGLICKS